MTRRKSQDVRVEDSLRDFPALAHLWACLAACFGAGRAACLASSSSAGRAAWLLAIGHGCVLGGFGGWSLALVRPAKAAPPSVGPQTLGPQTLGPQNPVSSMVEAARTDREKRLFEAKTALDARRFKAALELLPVEPGTPLEPYERALRALALRGLGKPKEALEALGAPEDAPRRCRDGWEDALFALRQEIRADLVGGTAPREAADILTALIPDAPRLARALEYLRNAKDADGVLEIERQLLMTVPESKEARELAEQLGAAGVGKALPSVEDRLSRIRLLLEGHDNERASDEAQTLLQTREGEPYRCELSFIIGKANRKLRKYGPAIRALAQARAVCDSDGAESDFRARAALLEINVRSIRGDARGTRRVVDWLVASHKGHSFVDDALAFLGDLLERKGDLVGAERTYRRILEDFRHGDQSSSSAWRLAMMAMEKKDFSTAISRLEQVLAGRVERPVERERARYWLARLKERALPEKAVELHRETALGLSFYGWMSLARVEAIRKSEAAALRKELLEAAKPRPAARSELPSAVVDSDAHRLAMKLFAAGAPDLAEGALSRLDCPGLSRKEALALALSLDAVGAHARAQRLIRERAAELLTAISPDSSIAWRTAYSLPYLDLVEKAARAEKIDPLLLLALMREESTFDPDIVSWAGAVGLTQLMPATAVGAYASVVGGKLDPEHLTEPELNIRLGARVLKEALGDFEGTEPLALGAYNAGAATVRRWLIQESTPFDQWVEGVTIKETRGYIQRVIETWGIYHLLYDSKSPFIALPQTIKARRVRR